MPISIPLVNGGFALVDPQDYNRLIQLPWRCNNKGYAMYIQIVHGKRREVYMHRLIMRARGSLVVDHLDGHRLNNVRSNLRLCTPQENLRYRRRFQNNLSGYKGVAKRNQGWLARIWWDGKTIRLGLYDTAQEAAFAYDYAARLLFEAFALFNFPDRSTPDVIRDQVLRQLEQSQLTSVQYKLRSMHRFA